jgi:mannose-6-phosphate isomerase-like protein (cupin superfamily)
VNTKIEISELAGGGDERGLSLNASIRVLEYLRNISDIHIASINPSAVRGNHYHLRRREAIVVLPGSAWSLHWDEGENTDIRRQQFSGLNSVLVLVPPGVSHALRNENGGRLWLIALSSERHDPSETAPRKLV